MITILEDDIEAFIAAPRAAYGPASPYAPMMESDIRRYLDRTRNPLWAKENPHRSFVAVRDGRPIGRIVAHRHAASDERHGWRRGCFGFFDCAHDLDAARALLNSAETFVKSFGAMELTGAFNLTAMQQLGVLVEGFKHAPYTDMVWNPPHLPQILEACGYRAFFPATTFEVDLTALDAGFLARSKGSIAETDPAFTFAPIDRRTFSARLSDARLVLNDGFDANPMFVPLTAAEYEFHAKEMMWILDPRLSVCLHHRGEPVGVVVCIPDLNPFLREIGGRMSWQAPISFLKHRLTRTRCVIIYYSVARAHHGQGLAGAMLARVTQNAFNAGYRSMGVTWIADENRPSLRQMEKLCARPLHRLSLFRKEFSA